MNKRSMRYNLLEAKEAIEKLLSNLDSKEEYSASYLQVGFRHAYFHLNTAWNTRRSPDDKVVNLSPLFANVIETPS